MADWEALKAAAAVRALDLVRPGMLLGLGTGSTVRYFIEELGARVRDGLDVRGVPTSHATTELARAVGIPIVEDEAGIIDLAVDGADEIDPEMRVVKGRGGALTREKLVASVARRFVVVADDSKLVDQLGVGPLRVEVLPFLWRHTAARIERLGVSWDLHEEAGAPFRSDNGNLILDVQFPQGIADPEAMADRLKGITGVVEHGLFLGMAHACILAGDHGVHLMGSLE
ncbi:MAG: ribose 5-phosphate isomerase [Chloroflexota bacterium]|jgi:ribose 5-phosphate isomerase A|nr:ribose 5-phosphate isomerase [Chloroflexota bacterium]